MAWDDTQTSSTSIDETEWNNMVTDQKSRSLVSSGSGAPATTPGSVGDIYVDTSNNEFYVAKGTSSSADWEKLFNEVIEDATPQLGGDLDANGNTITNLDASTTAKGIVELTTTTEVNTGTDTARAVTSDALAGSYAGTKTAQIECFAPTTDVAVGDGAKYLRIPSGVDGMDLVAVHAEVITAGTTGTTDIQIHNVTDAVDMLSTVITIDSGETGSDTAATAAVINTANDDVAENDVLRVDVDAISTTAPKGLLVTLEFRLP